MRGIRLLVVFILIIFSSSVIHAEFHHHNDSETKTSCSICVFASNLASGDGQSVHKIIVEQKTYEFIPLIYKNLSILSVPHKTNSKRAPPFINFFLK